jgi:hypothetical protein
MCKKNYRRAPDELQATHQPLFEDGMYMEPTPLKVEKEGDPCTLGLMGGGCQGCALGADLSGKRAGLLSWAHWSCQGLFVVKGIV